MPNSKAMELIAAWVAEANGRPDAAHAPDLQPLVEAFDGDTFIINAASGRGDDDRPRIVFDTYAPKGTELKRRKLHPVHAAMARVLTLAGAKIKAHQPHPGDNYQWRFSMDGIGLTNMTRIWFDAGHELGIRETKGSDYHDIVPTNYVLHIGPDRSDVEAVVRERDPQLADLLHSLFDLADRWHGSELKHSR